MVAPWKSQTQNFLTCKNFQKYKGISKPQRLDVEYLMLLENHLRELPSVLDKAVENIGQISLEHLNTGTGWCDCMKEDIEYLKEASKTLGKEASSVKKTVGQFSPKIGHY